MKHGPSARKRRRWPTIVAKMVLWLAVPVIIGAIVFFGFMQPDPEVKTATIRIKSGSTAAQVAEMLAAKGIISNSTTFKWWVTGTGAEAKLQPGKYVLRSDMKYEDILEALTKVKKKQYVRVVIPEGFTATQIVDRLAEATGRPRVDFLEYVRGQGLSQVRPEVLPDDLRTVEGYLFPKTYDIEKKGHPKKIVSRLIAQYEEETTGLDWQFAKSRGLSVHEIMTIASLVETEARLPEEREIVAAVIYNRIDKGMPLQIDATVQYALPERKEALTNNDLKIASPYNTYQKTGLPLGPIANPGLSSIKAALAPAQVDYIYYVLTSPDGRHTFTNNYNDFLIAKRRMPKTGQ